MSILRKYGVATHVYIPMVKRSAIDYAVSADWTPAAGDVKISKDGGAAANITTLPAAITMGNTAMWDFAISATEMQAAKIVITVADSATKAVEDQMIMIDTYGHASAEHEMDLDSPIITFPFRKNTALSNFEFVMIDSSDDISPKTGLTVTGQVSIDGGSFGALTNAVSEVANGVYKVNLAAADLNGNVVTLRFTATGANPSVMTFLLPN